MQRAAATSKSTAATALAQATARVLTLERAAGAALAQRADHLTQDQIHAKTERDRFNDDVRSGAVRLSIPVASGQCAATADSTTAAGNRHQARAELDPATAAALDAIAGDGDDATRQLNACIDAYNLVRDTYHVQTE
nr:lysis system i-spanin subunit Rz [Janthinobacterium lividum]